MCGWDLTEGGSCRWPGGVLAGFGLVEDCLVAGGSVVGGLVAGGFVGGGLVAGGFVGGGHCALSAAGSCPAGGCHLVWGQSLKS